MHRKRPKWIPAEEFAPTQDHDWAAVEVAQPFGMLRNVPTGMQHRLLASGQHNYADELRQQRIGGFDVYRHAPEDRVRFNKDHYDVYPGADGQLRVEGPFKDDEHWIDDVPERYRGVAIVTIFSK